MIRPFNDKDDTKQEVCEMKLLVNTLGYNVVFSDSQFLKSINPSTYFGKGKIAELVNKAKALNISTIFLNDEISASHYKNIKKISGDKIDIIDRTLLILNIFKKNARTKESRTQVDLAMLQYLMPRLTGMWTHLERQMGGVGTRGGPGEKQIEIDRRIIRKSINKLKKDLILIEKQRINQRKLRDNIYKISLVGYTNAGKSSLLKKITGYDALVKDQLFATLETTTKKLKLPSNIEVVISDTVGFLRKLPHSLIASFKSTLLDIKESDLLLKVIDISSNTIDAHIDTINNTLKELNAHNCKYLYVFNKIDLIDNNDIYKKIKSKYKNSIMISVENDLRINELLQMIDNIIQEDFKEYTIKIPHNLSNHIDYIYKNTSIINRSDDYENIVITFLSNKNIYEKITNLIKDKKKYS